MIRTVRRRIDLPQAALDFDGTPVDADLAGDDGSDDLTHDSLQDVTPSE